MKKVLLTSLILTIFICTTFLAINTIALATPTALDSDNFTLKMPESYEQYLDLVSPKDITKNNDYTVIADSVPSANVEDPNIGILYIFDGEVYSEYIHTSEITAINIANDNTLYFTDLSAQIWTLNCQTLASASTGISCQDFCLVENNDSTIIYYTIKSTTNISVYSSSNAMTPIASYTGKSDSCITSVGTDVFYSIDNVVHSIAGIAYSTSTNIKELTAYNYNSETYLCSLVDGNNTSLYRYNYTASEEASPINGAYSTVKYFDNSLFLVGTKSIKKYSLTEGNLEKYEVCSASDSEYRLNNAKHIDFYKNKAYIADTLNNRISVYDIQQDKYTIIDCTYNEMTFAPQFVCAGDNNILAFCRDSTTTFIYLYDFTYERWEQIYSTTNEVIGATYVFGNYYLADMSRYFYKYDCQNKLMTIAQKVVDGMTTAYISSDIDGTIYVAYKGSIEEADCYQIKKYSEEQFISNYQPATPIYTFDVGNIASIDIDFNGTFYALTTDGRILTSGSNEYNINVDGLIYEDGILPNCLALSFDSDDIYLLCKNLIVTTKSISIQNTKNITVDTVDEEIFSNQSVGVNEVSIVNITKNATCIEFDISRLENSTFFPYTRYFRLTSETNAVKLGDLDEYNIVVIYSSQDRAYSVNLVSKAFCEDVEPSEYLVTETADKISFTSNSVYLYKYPYLSQDLSITKLAKSSTITVLGEINLADELDYNYCYVSYATAEGVHATGYIPTAFLISIQAIKNEQTSVSHLFLQANSLELTATNGDKTTIKRGERLLVYNNADENEKHFCVYTDKDGKEFYAYIDKSSITPSGLATIKNLVLFMLVLAAILVVITYLVILKSNKSYALKN